MSVTSRLVFDPTDANSIASSHSVGAYVRAGSDGDLIASQTINSEEWLNVAASLFDDSGAAVNSGNPLPVDIGASTDVDIRTLQHDLDANGDSVRLGDGTGFLTSTSENGDLALDVHLSNTEIAVTQGSDSPWTVDATDLDIRDLSAASDSVAAWVSDGSGNAIGSTGGSLDVNVTNSIDVDDGIADTAIENTTTAVSTSAVNVVSSALANRKYLFLANEGNKTLYFGKNGVTTANGFPLYPGMQLEARIGPSVAPQIIGRTGASSEDLRVMELS